MTALRFESPLTLTVWTIRVHGDGWVVRRHDVQQDGSTVVSTLTGGGAMDVMEGTAGSALIAFWSAERPSGFMSGSWGKMRAAISGNPWPGWWRCCARDLEASYQWWMRAVQEAPCRSSKDGAMEVAQAGMRQAIIWWQRCRGPTSAMPAWMVDAMAEHHDGGTGDF